MSKKLALFLLAFGFAASFTQVYASANPVCIRNCGSFLQACNARGFGSAYCLGQYQNCLTICDNSVAP
jgi:hypothetical protein